MQTPSEERRETVLAAFLDQLERQVHALEIHIEHCEDENRRQAFRKQIAVLAGLESRFVPVKH